MILVTVGTYEHGFDRLVKVADELAKTIEETVVVQRGNSTYEPNHTSHFTVTTYYHMVELVQSARVVISHAAVGAVILALRHNKPLVLVPRLGQLAEYEDDYQLNLANFLENKGKMAVVYDLSPDVLQTSINKAVERRNIGKNGAIDTLKILRQYLKDNYKKRKQVM